MDEEIGTELISLLSERQPSAQPTLSTRSRTVRSAVAYIVENAHEALSVAEVCAASSANTADTHAVGAGDGRAKAGPLATNGPVANPQRLAAVAHALGRPPTPPLSARRVRKKGDLLRRSRRSVAAIDGGGDDGHVNEEGGRGRGGADLGAGAADGETSDGGGAGSVEVGDGGESVGDADDGNGSGASDSDTSGADLSEEPNAHKDGGHGSAARDASGRSEGEQDGTRTHPCPSPPSAEDAWRVLRDCSIVVGMHPDHPTESIVDFALATGKPFAVVPCCVL